MKQVNYTELVEAIKQLPADMPILLHNGDWGRSDEEVIAALVRDAGITPYIPKRTPTFNPALETVYRRMNSLRSMGDHPVMIFPETPLMVHWEHDAIAFELFDAGVLHELKTTPNDGRAMLQLGELMQNMVTESNAVIAEMEAEGQNVETQEQFDAFKEKYGKESIWIRIGNRLKGK